MSCSTDGYCSWSIHRSSFAMPFSSWTLSEQLLLNGLLVQGVNHDLGQAHHLVLELGLAVVQRDMKPLKNVGIVRLGLLEERPSELLLPLLVEPARKRT